MTGGSPLNVSRLRILCELAARGSITAVADALWLTPSAVSQQLTALERETGRKLIERAGRTVALTDAGRVLAHASEPVFAALADAEAALHALDDEPGGLVRLGAFPSVVRVVLPSLIARLQRRYPSLVVEVEDFEVEQSLTALHAGHIDVAIVDDLGWDTGARQSGLDVKELFTDDLVVVAPADHPLASLDTVTWADLADHDMISEPRSSRFSHTVWTECRRAGFEPNVVARVHDTAAMLAFVEVVSAVTVLPELAVLRNRPRGIVWRPLDPPVTRCLLAATRSRRPVTLAVASLLDELAAADPHASEAS